MVVEVSQVTLELVVEAKNLIAKNPGDTLWQLRWWPNLCAPKSPVVGFSGTWRNNLTINLVDLSSNVGSLKLPKVYAIGPVDDLAQT